MKEYYDAWKEKEIQEYIGTFKVLVLFVLYIDSKTAEIVIHGELNDEQRLMLLDRITNIFGGIKMSSSICYKINEFAEKWYNKNVLRRKARVINIKKGKK